MEKDPISFFKRQDLTKGLSDIELGQLLDLMELKNYPAGETIIEEGEKIELISFLYTGEIEVLKYGTVGEDLYLITTLAEGSFFGEMSFVDSNPTSATIRAKTDCTTYALSKKHVESLPFYDKLLKNIAACEIDRLRTTNKDLVQSLQIQLKESQLRNDFGRFFVVIIILFGIFDLIPNMAPFSPIKQVLYSWAVLIIVLIPISYFVRKLIMPISTFGITTKNWKKAVLEGFLYPAAIVPLLFLFKYLTAPAGEPLITWASMQQYSLSGIYLFYFLFIFHSFIQEFVARGVIQGSLQRFMSDSHYMIPILLASLICGVSHLHISVMVFLLTFIGSFIAGYFYYRHKNLIGITIMHFIVAIAAKALGYI